MPGLRVALAAVLGIAVGALMVAFPEVVIRVQTAGSRPDRQPGPAGEGNVGGLWTNAIRVIGALFLLGGLYFASRFVV
jgi:hypothetical protein